MVGEDVLHVRPVDVLKGSERRLASKGWPIGPERPRVRHEMEAERTCVSLYGSYCPGPRTGNFPSAARFHGRGVRLRNAELYVCRVDHGLALFP